MIDCQPLAINIGIEKGIPESFILLVLCIKIDFHHDIVLIVNQVLLGDAADILEGQLFI